MKWLTSIVREKVDVAKCLAQGGCGASEQEACIITTALLSGMASTLWSGQKIDRNRFIELCVKYTDPKLKASQISTPMLIETLHRENAQTGVNALKNRFKDAFLMFPGYDTLVVTGTDVDLSENDLSGVLTVDSACLRGHSYASLLYSEVRCGFAHEYRLGNRAGHVPMTSRDEGISYINRGKSKTRRLIHFRYQWIENIVLSICDNLEQENVREPLELPSHWWIKGREEK